MSREIFIVGLIGFGGATIGGAIVLIAIGVGAIFWGEPIEPPEKEAMSRDQFNRLLCKAVPGKYLREDVRYFCGFPQNDRTKQ